MKKLSYETAYTFIMIHLSFVQLHYLRSTLNTKFKATIVSLETPGYSLKYCRYAPNIQKIKTEKLFQSSLYFHVIKITSQLSQGV